MSEEATLDEFVNEESDCDASENEMRTSLDQTSVGNIPDDWSAVRLGELTENTLYGANESAEDYDPDKPRYIRIKDIDSRGRLKNTDKASLSPEKAEGYLLNEGDMLFARSGSPGRTYLHRHESGKYCYGGYSIKHELVSENLNHEYISQYTKSQKYWDWIERIARTGAQANINSREYSSLLVPLPPLPEQRKIATVLYTVDQAIEKTEEVIQQYKKLKSGVLEELLREGIKDHDQIEQNVGPLTWTMPDSWSVKPVGELSELVHGHQFRSGDFADNGKIPVLKIGQITESGIDLSDADSVSEQELEDYADYTIESGSPLIALSGATWGKTGYFESYNRPVLQNYRVGKVVTDNSVLDKRFLYHIMESSIFQKQLQGQVVRQAQENIGKSDFERIRIPVPQISEQKQISGIISDIEKCIQGENMSKQTLKSLKTGLMQDLLSGTVRTTDTNITVPDEVAQYG